MKMTRTTALLLAISLALCQVHAKSKLPTDCKKLDDLTPCQNQAGQESRCMNHHCEDSTALAACFNKTEGAYCYDLCGKGCSGGAGYCYKIYDPSFLICTNPNDRVQYMNEKLTCTASNMTDGSPCEHLSCVYGGKSDKDPAVYVSIMSNCSSKVCLAPKDDACLGKQDGDSCNPYQEAGFGKQKSDDYYEQAYITKYHGGKCAKKDESTSDLTCFDADAEQAKEYKGGASNVQSRGASAFVPKATTLSMAMTALSLAVAFM